MRERIGSWISGVCKRPAEATLTVLNCTQSDPLIAEPGFLCEAKPEMHCLLRE